MFWERQAITDLPHACQIRFVQLTKDMGILGSPVCTVACRGLGFWRLEGESTTNLRVHLLSDCSRNCCGMQKKVPGAVRFRNHGGISETKIQKPQRRISETRKPHFRSLKGAFQKLGNPLT